MVSGSLVSFDTLLAHEPFLRRLAWGLVGEHASVDDLVQDTLVAAVEHPPPARGLRAWLATVLRNRARERWRREQRRRKREAEASKPELAVPLADRDRVRERIVRAVLELAEPYRTAVLLRYLDGLKPREIAARLDVPVETVRTRVKRGLKLLRDRLEDEPEFAAGWSLALVALVDRPVRRGAGAGTALGGILVMNAKLIIVTLIVAAATLIVWQAWPASPAPPRAVAAERSDAGPEAPSDGAAAIKPDARDAPPADPGVASAPAPLLLRGKLIPAPGTAPGVAVLSVYKPGHTPEAEIVRGQTRNDLTFELDVGPLAHQKGVARLLIQVDHPAHMPAVASAVVRPGPEIEPVVVSLAAAAIIEGRVTEQGGAPVPRARVAVFEWAGAPSDGGPIERVRTDDEGL